MLSSFNSNSVNSSFVCVSQSIQIQFANDNSPTLSRSAVSGIFARSTNLEIAIAIFL